MNNEYVSFKFNPYSLKKKEENDKTIVKIWETDEKVKLEDAEFIPGLQLWVKKDDPRIIKDHISGNSILYSFDLLGKVYNSYIIIFTDIDEKGNLKNPKVTLNNIVTSHPEISELNNIVITDNKGTSESYQNGRIRIFIDKSLLSNKVFNYYYKQDFQNGLFYHKSVSLSITDKPHKHIVYRKVNRRPSSFLKTLEYEKKPLTYIKMLNKKYSFGVEIETCAGSLPRYYDNDLFYTAVHDGSLRDEDGNVYGGEYVTDVLKGDLGLLQLNKLSNALSKYCLLNSKCGVHVHIGDITFNKENIILMYHLYRNLEKEIFNMLPESRRKNEYCRALPKLQFDIDNLKGKNRKFYIDLFYDDIIQILSGKNKSSASINKKYDHPKGNKCGYDHSTARYCWVNFIPAVFNTRKNNVYTIEFRPHSATTSYYKIKMWLFICIALVDIVENHKSYLYDNFENISLQDIIKECYPNNYIKINEYIVKRTLKFSEKNKEADDYSDNEVLDEVSIKTL